MRSLKAIFSPAESQSRKPGLLVGIAILAAAYYAAARLGLLLAFAESNATPFWPPSGIAFAALLLFGYRFWPGITIGAFFANVVVFAANQAASPGTLAIASLTIAIGNTLEAITGTVLFRHFIGEPERLMLPKNVYKFLMAAALMSAVSASLGTTTLILTGIVPLPAQWTVMGTWWLGDFAGAMVVTPALLAWSRSVAPRYPVHPLNESAVSLMVLVLLIVVVFGQEYVGGLTNRILAFLLIPAIGWAAYRHGPRGVSLVLLLLTGGAVWATTSGFGPFASGTLNDSMLMLEIYIALCSLTGLVLTADLHDRRRAVDVQVVARDIAAPWLTLFFSLALTILAWNFIAAGTEQRARDRFEYLAEDIEQRIVDRMQAYEQVLRSGKALFSSSEAVHRAEWYQFAEDLHIEKYYPGIQGYGFTKRVLPAEKDALVQEMRKEGIVDFRIWPDQPRDEYTAILYLSPLDERNARALGYDMFSEPVRHEAMERARDSGAPAVSGKVVLVQETQSGVQAGFLMYLPVYRNGAPTATVDQRRAALQGYVYAPFRMNDLMDGVLGTSLPEFTIDIFDGVAETEQGRMYTTATAPRLRSDYPNRFTTRKVISVNDRQWTVRVTSLPAFEAGIDRQKSLIVLVAGTIISLLFFSMVRTLATTRIEALALAKEMTAALRESEVRFESLVESASEFAIIATDLDGIIRIFSIGGERMLGYRAEELVGKQKPSLFHIDAEIKARTTQLAAETGEPVEEGDIFIASARRGHAETREWTYQRKDGSRLPVQLTISPIRGMHGEVKGFVGIARDVTEERRTKEELRAAIQQAQSASEAKSNFVANMSHELRTPMNAVLGMAYLMGNTALSPDQRKYLDMIQTSGQSLLHVLNDILDFSKIEAGRMELAPARFRLGDVLNALTMIMGVSAGEKDLEVALGVEPDVPEWFIGDALRIQQVLLNLAGNAIKFTRKGEVALLVDVAERYDGTIALRFRVRDTGVGMTEEQRKGLFSAFYQADSSTTRRFGGTGLGLVISARLVDMMGGRIVVQSEHGKGSEFTVTIPLHVADAATANEPAEAPLRDLRLLVVDDNATSRDCISKAIAALHWHADIVDSGAQALSRLHTAQASGQAYDAMLVDWQMPEMDGAATIQAVRAGWPGLNMRIIMMSSEFARSRLMEGQPQWQTDAVLAKPFTRSALADTVRQALSARALQETAEHAAVAASQRIDGARLLLVEDNPMNQIVARKILEQAGATVEVVDDGLKAVSLLRDESSRFDLVLMDVQMPVMDGYAATRMIRENLELSLPVLAMTAGVMESERQRCITSGMDDFIAKPIDVDQMLAAIARHLPAGTGTASAAPVSTAPALPAFDAEQITLLTTGDPAYADAIVDVLRKVISKGTTELKQARAAWREKRTDEAARMLHTMRGSIGSLGAKQFAEAALVLETAIHEGKEHAVEPLFDKAIDALEAAIAAASDWISQHNTVLEGQAGAFDADALARLETLLSEHDVAAIELYGKLRPGLVAHLQEQDMQALDRAIEDLDFSAACHCLRRASAQLVQPT